MASRLDLSHLVSRALAAGLLTASFAANAGLPNQLCLADDPLTAVTNCTANDFGIQTVQVTNVKDGCTGPNDTAIVDIVVTLDSASSQRYDVGMYIAEDGGDAIATGGSCFREALFPTGTPIDLLSGVGPYPAVDGDTCGDVGNNQVARRLLVDGDVSSGSTTAAGVEIACTDIDNNGIVDTGWVVAWDNNANTACNSVLQAVPGTPAKCESGRVQTGLFLYPDYGDAPDSYGTRLANNGAANILSPNGFHLGFLVDPEPDGQPSANALGDDTDVTGTPPGNVGGDDEDGVLFFVNGSSVDPSKTPVQVVAGTTQSILLVAFGGDGVLGTPDSVVSAWFDWNRDGDFLDAGEAVLVNRPVDGAPGGTINPVNIPVPSTATPGPTFARFRLTRGGTGSTNSDSPNGLAGEGEVEDHPLTIVNNNLDFGDAPDSYGTTLASTSRGARHLQVPGLYLGTQIDVEGDAWTPLDGTGDDVNPATPDDEDGATFQTFAGPGFPIEATVTGSVGLNPAYLCAYLDGAADGTVDDQFTSSVSYSGSGTIPVFNLTGAASAGNEEICVAIQGTGAPVTVPTATNIPPSSGFNGATASCTRVQSTGVFTCTIRFNPNFTSPQTTYARFRLTTDASFNPLTGTPSPTGPADSGEVEDYRILVNPTAVTIGSVELAATGVQEFLAGLGVDGMDTQALLDLLAAWDPAAAAALVGADREAILAALRRYLDPDGDGQVAVLRWDTLEQRGTVGFYVDRREEGRDSWLRINGDMLPALVGAPLGGEYLLADPTARAGVPYEYTLIEQEAQGTTRSYGPFRLEVSP